MVLWSTWATKPVEQFKWKVLRLPQKKLKEMGEEEWVRQVVEAISHGEEGLVRALLSEGKVDAVDGQGMTPLQHAAYKGQVSTCELLLDQGADPNGGRHEHKYSALHFAALSGNPEACRLLLTAGAHKTATNSVGRTPSQMAAFVGNHQCVAAINSFVALEEVEQWAAAGEERLPPELVAPLHRLVATANMHPVRVLLQLRAYPRLVPHLLRVAVLLEHQSHRLAALAQQALAGGSAGGGEEELLALKVHVLAQLLRAFREELQAAAEQPSAEAALEGMAKNLLRGRPSDGTPVRLERLVRHAMATYHWRQSPVFRQLVSGLQAGAEDAFCSGTQMLQAALAGQAAFRTDADSACGACGQHGAQLRCARCRALLYCDRLCQRLHWPSHKRTCAAAVAPSEAARAGGQKDVSSARDQ